MALTIANEMRKAGLDGMCVLLNGGNLRFLTAADTEIALLPLSATAFAAASTASPSVALSNAITADTTITASTTIGKFELRTSGNANRLAGTVGVGSGDFQVTSATVPPTATEVTCTGGISLSLQLS